MAKNRNIPQAIKDNVLHYINQVYDEAYELGYQHGKRQGESDIEKTQRMIEDAVQSLKELTINQTNKSDDLPCDTCEYFHTAEEALPCCECMYAKVSKYRRSEHGLMALLREKDDRDTKLQRRIQNKSAAVDKLIKDTYTKDEVVKIMNAAVYW